MVYAVRCVLFGVCCVLIDATCVLAVVCCVLVDACCLLGVVNGVGCLLFVA